MLKHISTGDLNALVGELLRLPQETEWVEFKRDYVDAEKIGKYVSALANSAALTGNAKGYVVWGVADGTRELVGTSFRPAKHMIGNEALENWLSHNLIPRIDFRFHEFKVDERMVALLEIPSATTQPVQFRGIEYIRLGSYTKKLKEHVEKERRLWSLFDATPFEQQIAADKLDASEVLSLLDYRAYFKLMNMPLPESLDAILERLRSENIIEQRLTGKWCILNLGAILFAVELPDFSHLARKMVRIVEYEGQGRVRTKRERVIKRGYAAGFEDLIEHLTEILPENEVIGAAFRRSVPMYPELAIRELVANHLIHQDFSITGTGPMIEIFDGRLEISNPGTPLVETHRFLDLPPRSRNEAMASFLRRAGICEERGSGIDKVVFESELYQLPAPLFKSGADHTLATLFAYRKFSQMDRNDRVRACYLHACLQYVQQSKMTNRSLRERFGIDERNRAQVTRVIKEALADGQIKPYDPTSESRKHACYVPFWA